MEKNYFLPAEWHPQSYIQLTWPHSETDWNYMLDDVEACFLNLAREIASRQPLLLVAPEYPEILKGLDCKDNIHYISCPTNDTWARDHGFITLLQNDGTPLLLDFCFNGWGMKFAANKDNLINSRIYQSKLLNGEYINCRNFVLEGGSIESDGKGTLLTTSTCLLAPNRNDTMDRSELEKYLKKDSTSNKSYGWITDSLQVMIPTVMLTPWHVCVRTTPLSTYNVPTRLTSTIQNCN